MLAASQSKIAGQAENHASRDNMAVRPEQPAFVSETEVRVRYAETDAMGIVHHSAYIVWFEAGRSDFMRHIGSSYSAVERAGFYFRLAELGARYAAPAFYDELLIVRTWIGEMHSRELVFRYAVVRPSDAATEQPEQILATGFTKLVCTDAEGCVRRLPAEVRRQFESLTLARSAANSA